MQTGLLKLKEIIWEITNVCNNNCSYCGSLGRLKKVFTQEDGKRIYDILKEIAKYPPEEINISGGDPLEVPEPIHNDIKRMLSYTKIKIIINPLSVCEDNYNILSIYDVIGVSVNTIEEVTRFFELLPLFAKIKKTPTVITNFSMNNIWIFDEIMSCVGSEMVWQIQYNMTEGKNNIYDNEQATKYLHDKIREAMGNCYARIVIADNMNNGQCGAGVNGLGIAYDGLVYPCLSMVVWDDDAGECYIQDEGLEKIWKTGFTKYRCGEFECCKDICKNKFFIDNTNRNTIVSPLIKPITMKPDYDMPMIVMYGVQPNTTFVYGVGGWNDGTED